MEKVGKLDTVHLLPEIEGLLIELLESLSYDDWEKQTLVAKWRVKDVVAHLLDGNLRALSMLRDDYYGETAPEINSYRELVSFLNVLNADWVKAARRLSPKILISLLKSTGKEYCDFLATLNLDESATFPVAWAGENESKNWFHIAREYTEKWHHQQQIRHAIGDEQKLLENKWFLPYLDTSVRAIPHHFRNVTGQTKDLVKFTFIGETINNWFLSYDDRWILYSNTTKEPTCEVKIYNEIAWKIFTNGISNKEAIRKSEIIGSRKLGEKIFDMLAVLA